jgi:hypothetical protein
MGHHHAGEERVVIEATASRSDLQRRTTPSQGPSIRESVQRYPKITNKAASHDGLIVKAGYKATAFSPCGGSGHQPIGADRHDPGP